MSTHWMSVDVLRKFAKEQSITVNSLYKMFPLVFEMENNLKAFPW